MKKKPANVPAYKMLPKPQVIRDLLEQHFGLATGNRGGTNLEIVLNKVVERVKRISNDGELWPVSKRLLQEMISLKKACRPCETRRLKSLAQVLRCRVTDIAEDAPVTIQQPTRRDFSPKLRWIGNVQPEARYFEGREPQLSDLDEMFERESWICLCGESGIGKTALARRFPKVSWREFRTAVWLNGGSLHSLHSSLAGFATHFIPRSHHSGMPNENFLMGGINEVLMKQLARQQPWIFVLDGVDGSEREMVFSKVYSLLKPHLGEENKLLVTAIEPLATTQKNIIQIKGLDAKSGIRLLLQPRWAGSARENEDLLNLIPSRIESIARRICLNVGGSPLMIEGLAFNIALGENLKEVLAALSKGGAQLLDGAHGAIHHNAWTTFVKPFINFQKENPAQAELVQLCALLNGASISKSVVEMVALSEKCRFKRLKHLLREPRGFINAVHKASIWLRLQPAGETVHMHSSIRVVMQSYMHCNADWTNHVDDVRAIFADELFSPNEKSLDVRRPNQLTLGSQMLSHLEYIISDLGETFPIDETSARLMGGMAFIFNIRGDAQMAESFFKGAIRIVDEITPEPSRLRCSLLLELSQSLCATDNVPEANKILEQCLAEAKRLPQKLPFFVARAYHHYAHSLLLSGDTRKAIASSNKALELLRKNKLKNTVAYALALGENGRIQSVKASRNSNPDREITVQRKAEKLCLESVSVMKDALKTEGMGYDHLLADVLLRLSEVRRRTGDACLKADRRDEAIRYYHGVINTYFETQSLLSAAGMEEFPCHVMHVLELMRVVGSAKPEAAVDVLEAVMEHLKDKGRSGALLRKFTENLLEEISKTGPRPD